MSLVIMHFNEIGLVQPYDNVLFIFSCINDALAIKMVWLDAVERSH